MRWRASNRSLGETNKDTVSNIYVYSTSMSTSSKAVGIKIYSGGYSNTIIKNVTQDTVKTSSGDYAAQIQSMSRLLRILTVLLMALARSTLVGRVWCRPLEPQSTFGQTLIVTLVSHVVLLAEWIFGQAFICYAPLH
jgi:hypothetical protein